MTITIFVQVWEFGKLKDATCWLDTKSEFVKYKNIKAKRAKDAGAKIKINSNTKLEFTTLDNKTTKVWYILGDKT